MGKDICEPARTLKAGEFAGMAPEAAEAFRALMGAMHAHRQAMARSAAAHGMHFGQLACLRILAERDGMSQRDLAEQMHLSRPAVTSMLQAVEKGGGIVRRPDEADQRLTRVYLTEEGRRLAEELRSVMAEYINATFGTLTADECVELTRLLHKLRGAAGTDGCPADEETTREEGSRTR